MLIALLLVVGFSLPQAVLAQPFVVTNTNDAGAGSLRQAILDANANFGPDVINFDITEVPPIVIAPLTELPPISESVLIDGYSQPGTLANTAAEGSNAEIHIVLYGDLGQDPDSNPVDTGLTFQDMGSQVRGVSFLNWFSALLLDGIGNHVVTGNWFGIAPDGSNTGNSEAIRIASPNCVIGAPLLGSPQLAHRNLIANSDVGINTSLLAADDARIQNNFIGTDPSGTAQAGNVFGVQIRSRGVTIGGLGALEANVVGWSRSSGISVFVVPEVTIRGNRIFKNGELGIDLNHDGVTENDGAPDGDPGPNNLQNFPVLESVARAGGIITMTGTLDSAPNTNFLLDFYANSVRDNGPPDNAGRFHGEGEMYLGTANISTDGNGHANFIEALPAPAVGAWISTTATDPDGNTSEFSTTLPVPGENCTVTNTNASGPGSFDGCLIQFEANGNNVFELDLIDFNIPGGGKYTVPHNDDTAPFSPNIIIDFTTQPGFVPPDPENPCTGFNLPVTVEANPPDIDVFNNTLIDGIDLVGSMIIKSGAGGVNISNSRMTASLVGAGLFMDGDLSHASRSVFVSMGNVSGLAVTGDMSHMADICVRPRMGIFAGASGNKVRRPTVVLNLDGTVAIENFGGGGNTFTEIRTVNSNPPSVDSPAGAGVTIDLGGDGHTENDPLDADEGPNDLQNHPVIASATSLAGAVNGVIQSRVVGVLDSEPESEYRIEAYANAACAANDYGPAERYIGFTEVTTDNAGHAEFTLESTVSIAEGEVVVASATSLSGSTSELSACVTVTPGNTVLIFRDGFEFP